MSFLSPYLVGLKEQFKDKVNIWLFFFVILVSATDYILWHFYLSDPTLFVYLPVPIYPVKMLALIALINTLLSISAYPKEKEISYLLHIGSIIVSLLVLALEIFYIIDIYLQ